MVNGGLCLETMTLFWEERFHEQKWVLALFKWFQICCCPDRPHTYVCTWRGCTYMAESLFCRSHVFSWYIHVRLIVFLEDYATLENRQLLPPLPVGRKVPSLKNVNNGLLCYCRSTQELHFFYAKILCYLTDTNHFGTWNRFLLSLSKALQIMCIMYTFLKIKTGQKLTNVKRERCYLPIKASSRWEWSDWPLVSCPLIMKAQNR